MSSTQSDSWTQQGNGARRAERATRRVWSQEEEAVLIAALKELVATNQKSDNGFKPGYLPKLEDAISKAFPGTDLKGIPHINSKLQAWKKNYGSLVSITARSGVGFNVTGTHQIDCTADQWEQIVKCDLNAKTMRYKSWPLFEDWKEIFGKDRATGEGAHDVINMVNELMHTDNRATADPRSDETEPNLNDFSFHSGEENNSCQSEKRGNLVHKKSKTGKKRKCNDLVKSLGDVLLSIGQDTNKRLDKIASRIGYEYDQDQAKQDAFDLLDDIPGLSLEEQFDITEMLVDKPSRLLIFKGLPPKAKAPYVQRLRLSKPN